MYKKHKWFSGLWNICTFNQLRQICDLTSWFKTVNLCLIANLAQCKLTGKCLEITYVYYTHRSGKCRRHFPERSSGQPLRGRPTAHPRTMAKRH